MNKSNAYLMRLHFYIELLIPIHTNNLCICVYRIDLLVGNSKPSESIDFKGLNGGSGWTRTTDLTLISRQFILINPIE